MCTFSAKMLRSSKTTLKLTARQYGQNLTDMLQVSSAGHIKKAYQFASNT